MYTSELASRKQCKIPRATRSLSNTKTELAAAMREALRQERRERRALLEEYREMQRKADEKRKHAARKARDERRRRRMAKRDRHRRQDEFYVVGDEVLTDGDGLQNCFKSPPKAKRKRREYTHPLYSVGDEVIVWSMSAKKWYRDGTVKKIGANNKLFVHYDTSHPSGLSRRWITEEEQPKFIRKKQDEKKDSCAFQIPPPRLKTPCRSPIVTRVVSLPASEPIMKSKRSRSMEQAPTRRALGEITQPNFRAPLPKVGPSAHKVHSSQCRSAEEKEPAVNLFSVIKPAPKPVQEPIPVKRASTDFGVSDYDSDFTDESEDEQPGFKRGRRIPTWARGHAIKGAVAKQHGQDPERVFGPLLSAKARSCDLSVMFAKFQQRQKYLKRKESANWSKDGLTRQEEMGYKSLMGWL